MNTILWILAVASGLFLLNWLLDTISRLFRLQFDPMKKVREEIAEQNGLEIVPIIADPFAVQGNIGTRFVKLYSAHKFTKMFALRRRVTKYEIAVSNPHKIDLSFHSGILVSSFQKYLSKAPVDPSEKAFQEQFRISGHSANVASEFVKNEKLRQGLLKISWRTGGIKVDILQNRIVCQEAGARTVSSILGEVAIAGMIFEILLELADLVDSWQSSTTL